MKAKRERVIVEVKDLAQAAKIEETVGTGYCDVIAEFLTNWIAVEEDLIESYGRFPKAEPQVQALADESGRNLVTLGQLLATVEELGRQRRERVRSIKALERPSK